MLEVIESDCSKNLCRRARKRYTADGMVGVRSTSGAQRVCLGGSEIANVTADETEGISGLLEVSESVSSKDFAVSNATDGVPL